MVGGDGFKIHWCKPVWVQVPLAVLKKIMIFKIISFCSQYEVSNTGIVRRVKDGKIKKSSLNPRGYEIIGFRINGHNKYKTVHRLVAENFIPNLEKKRCLNFNPVGYHK